MASVEQCVSALEGILGDLAANLQRQSDLRYLASFNFGGHVAKLTVQADNLKNPFLNNAVQRFRCGG